MCEAMKCVLRDFSRMQSCPLNCNRSVHKEQMKGRPVAKFVLLGLREEKMMNANIVLSLLTKIRLLHLDTPKELKYL